MCSQRRRCPTCHQQNVGLSNIERHLCWHVDCPSCHEYVHADKHLCFIQRAPKPQEKKRKRTRQKGPRAKRGAAAEPHAPEEEEEALPPLHVFFDIEAMQPKEQHIANLVVAETEDDDPPKRFSGPFCTRDFLEWLDTLTLHDTRQVNVLAHNFQGYDGYFIIHQYYGDNRIVQQLRNGCKLLEVKHDHIRFIDSMSFFQMPLSAFPKTFGLTELCKGYFPHKFNLPDDRYQNYVGIIPALDYYMPDTMSPEGKQALETWHQEQHNQGVVFNFQQELLSYCESDVRLLKQGCLTFKRLFEDLTGFNPFEHITITSACNRDLRMNRMIPYSIASEPTRGWRNKINQSTPALHWLTWCDHQLRQRALQDLSPDDLDDHDLLAGAYPDHPSHRQYVQHVRNAGEYKIRSPVPRSMWMVIAPTPTPSTNFKGVSPTDALPVIQTATKNIPVTMIGLCKTFTKPLKTKSNSLPNKGTTSFKCGDVNGNTSKKPDQKSTPSSKDSTLSHLFNLETLSVEVEPMPSNSTIISPPAKRSTTSMSPPCTRGSTRRVSTPKDIRPSFHNRVTPTSFSTLDLFNAKSYLPGISTILSCLTVKMTNSPFPFVPPVSKTK